MTSRPRSICLPPAAVLALSVLLCGGAFTEPATAALLLQHADEGSCATADPLRGPGRSAAREQRKAVASLLSCLADAAKQLQIRPDQHRPAATFADVDQASALPPALEAPQAPGLVLHPLHSALPQHLDLPPPAATL